MAEFVRITGVKELDDALSYLRDKSAKRIGKAAVRRMANVTAQFIRRQVPRELRVSGSMKGIGWRSDKAKLSNIQGAKAGVAVGKSQKEAFAIVNKGNVSTQQYNVNKKLMKFLRTGRKGVGISARNLHWFAAGTADRYTGSKRNRAKIGPRRKPTGNPIKFVGRIDKAKFGGFVQRGATAGKSTAIAEAAKVVNRMIAAEATAARAGGQPPVEIEVDLL